MKKAILVSAAAVILLAAITSAMNGQTGLVANHYSIVIGQPAITRLKTQNKSSDAFHLTRTQT